MKTNNLHPAENESAKITLVETTVRVIGESAPSDKKTKSLSPIRKETTINDDEAITLRIHVAEIVEALDQAADQNEETGSDSK